MTFECFEDFFFDFGSCQLKLTGDQKPWLFTRLGTKRPSFAKGMGGDHSSMGIGIAKSFCERHRLGLWETNLICWLVEHHLLMSTTAQRKDIFDPDVVRTFAEQVGDQVRLDYDWQSAAS